VLPEASVAPGAVGAAIARGFEVEASTFDVCETDMPVELSRAKASTRMYNGVTNSTQSRHCFAGVLSGEKVSLIRYYTIT